MVTIMTGSSLGGTFWHAKENVLKSPPYETFNLVLKLTENNRDSLRKLFWQGEIRTLRERQTKLRMEKFHIIKAKEWEL